MAGNDRETVVDPLWYKDAVIYELHVKTFCDSDGDGMGDFRGLIKKLDYFQELGITAIWLLPFYPSPLRDDGYDIADYFDVKSNFGTLDDFRAFLDAAHERNLRVITELVINHTSDQNPWFQKSRRAVAAVGIGDPGKGQFTSGAAVDARGYNRPFVSVLNRALNCRDDPVDVWQRRVLINRVVADHDVCFADQNRRGDHFIPKIRNTRDVRNQHLTNTAIFGVLLNDDQPVSLAHRFLDCGFVPWND